MNKSQCREMLTKEIRTLAGGRSLKNFKIEKKVQYNRKEYDNREGLKCDDDSGIWKMGTTIEPDEHGYTMINWTVVHGKVTWNAEIRFNKKMTPQVSHINSFMGSPMVFNGTETCSQYLGQLLSEWENGFMTEKNGWTFKN
jgi:hypothetical protein